MNLFSFAHETDIIAINTFSFCVLKNKDHTGLKREKNIFSENLNFSVNYSFKECDKLMQ